MTSALEVAKYLIQLAANEPDEPEPMTLLRVQKLLYYSQGWHVGLFGHPAADSVPGSFPFPANRMVFHFSIDDYEGNRWGFAAHFRYGSDEQTIHVFALTVLPPTPHPPHSPSGE
jgi:hypothetical protein